MTATHHSQDFDEYLKLLLRLHELIVAGEGDTEAADDLRDAMDGPWSALDPTERERLEGISADLYMLFGEEILATVPDEQRTREWLGPRYAAARDAGDRWQALALLRHGPVYLSKGQIATLRAVLYDLLGLPQVAVPFYELSLSLPHHPASELVHIRLLLELGRTDEALVRAKLAAEQQIAALEELVAV